MTKENKRVAISPFQAASVFKEMLGVRREYCGDGEFFKAISLWEDLASDCSGIRIRTFKGSGEPQSKKAGVIAFDERFTLIVSEEFVSEAKKGRMFQNFTLAHELGHIGMDHHGQNAVVKNFELFSSVSGLANIPPTYEELEANYAAVFLQCGIALFDETWEPLELAKRAHSDVEYVKKAVLMCKQPQFKAELKRLDEPRQRVIL